MFVLPVSSIKPQQCYLSYRDFVAFSPLVSITRLKHYKIQCAKQNMHCDVYIVIIQLIKHYEDKWVYAIAITSEKFQLITKSSRQKELVLDDYNDV